MLEIFLVLPSPDSLSLSLVLPTCMCVCVWVCVGYAGFSFAFAFPFTIFFLRLLILFWPKRQQQRQQQAQQKAQQSVHWAWTRSTIVPDSQATFSLPNSPSPSLSLFHRCGTSFLLVFLPMTCCKLKKGMPEQSCCGPLRPERWQRPKLQTGRAGQGRARRGRAVGDGVKWVPSGNSILMMAIFAAGSPATATATGHIIWWQTIWA